VAQGPIGWILVAIRITIRIQEFFKRLFIYNYNSYWQPRIKILGEALNSLSDFYSFICNRNHTTN